MRILAIETSCDETAAAIVEAKEQRLEIITDVVASQLETHAKTGGVIPDIAARLHTENLPRVLNEATKRKKLDYDAVAVTVGPGLVGCLLIGLSAAKTIAQAKGLPFFPINHLEGHTYSAWIKEPQPQLPAIIVIVSGGHSELIYMERHLYYKHLGSTRDDAAGEAFDKVARLMGLPYPGGPAISHLAKEGNDEAYKLPLPLPEHDELDFSFSGLKAAVANLVNKLPDPLPRHTKADIAASFQKTVSNTICRKTISALQSYPGVRSVCLVGGVAANSYLRTHLEQAINQQFRHVDFIVPAIEYCTDNAAMIGAAAQFHALYGKPGNWYDTEADPNLELPQS